MDTLEIVLISSAVAILGVRLYQKYIKKAPDKPDRGVMSGSQFSSASSSKEDDYEPYSKK